MSISPQRLMRAMSAVSQLKAELAGYEDDTILASIESETEALELMDRMIEQVLADKALIEKARERIDRLEQRAERRRTVLQAMMEEINERVERPLATVSLANAARPVMVTDPDAVPEDYWRRSIDKTELARALRAGEEVAGATLGNAPRVLRISSR